MHKRRRTVHKKNYRVDIQHEGGEEKKRKKKKLDW